MCKFFSLSPTSSKQRKNAGLPFYINATASATDAGEDEDNEEILSSDTGDDDCRRYLIIIKISNLGAALPKQLYYNSMLK